MIRHEIGRRRYQTRLKPLSGWPELTALVDILFLVLIFFFLSSSFVRVSGISVNDPVITSEGVVGWVSKVEATTSYVTTILSPDTNIGVISKEKRESGVVSSDLLLADQGLVRMSYLTDETKLEEGNIITTTGLAGIFPKDLIVGQVKSLEVSDGGVTRCALIEPYVDVKEVHDVFVITDFYGKGEISESTTDTTSQENSEKETSSESSEESAKGDS